MNSRQGAFIARAHAAGLAGVLALCAGASAGPQPEPSIRRPEAARRVVRTFDFEEPTNPHPIPDHWWHAQDDPQGIRRPGFPKFNEAAFDRALAATGQASVRLPTRGGSTCLRLAPGEVPVFPDADYSVSAKVHTTELEHARGFITARLLDQQLQPIPGSEVRSEPVLAPSGWTDVSVVVPGRWSQAAWLQVDLELLQPEKFLPPPSGALAQHVIRHSDVSGGVLFDDVSIALLPRTRFWCEEPTGIVVEPQRPRLGVLARDQAGEELRARIRVSDADGRQVAEKKFVLDPSARPVHWTPKLPGFGWFRCVLEIEAAGWSVSRSELWLAHLPKPLTLTPSAARSSDLVRFGLAADDLPESMLADLGPLVERTRTRFVSIPAFDPLESLEAARETLDARAPSIEHLLALGQEVTLAVGTIPPALASANTLDATDALGMAALDPALWSGHMDPALDVLGQRIVRYQLGGAGDTHALRRDPAAGLANFQKIVRRMVPGAKVSLPWRADYPLPADLKQVSGLTVTFPSGFAPDSMAGLVDMWRDACAAGSPFELTVIPELPDAGVFGGRARAVEAARRIAEFWHAFAAGGEAPANLPVPRLALDSPWRIASSGSGAADERRITPGPELGVLALMAERLAGRRVVSDVPAAPGVRAFVLAERAGAAPGGAGSTGQALVRACVVAWNEGAPPEHAWVDVYPSRQSVEVVDIFGNTTSVAPSASGEGAAPGVQVRIPLGDSPVFIEGVDPYLAQYTSSLKLTPSFIPAVITAHEHRIELTNPWPVRITGQIQLKERATGILPVGSAQKTTGKTPVPSGGRWTISPNVIDFAAAPGETVSLPVTISFGAAQLAGTKELALVSRVLADRQYPAIHAAAMVEIGLPDLELTPEVQLSPTPSGPDVVIIAGVTNKDTRARSLRLEVAARDFPTQTLQISALPPGETIYKRFVLRDGVRKLAGKHARVTLSDDERAARLSKAVLVPGG